MYISAKALHEARHLLSAVSQYTACIHELDEAGADEFSCLTVPICLQLFSRMHTYGSNQETRTHRLFLNDLTYAQCMRFSSMSNHIRKYGTVQTFFHRSSRRHQILASALNEACHKRQNPRRRKYYLEPPPFPQLRLIRSIIGFAQNGHWLLPKPSYLVARLLLQRGAAERARDRNRG